MALGLVRSDIGTHHLPLTFYVSRRYTVNQPTVHLWKTGGSREPPFCFYSRTEGSQ
jgi:hypothetical protein